MGMMDGKLDQEAYDQWLATVAYGARPKNEADKITAQEYFSSPQWLEQKSTLSTAQGADWGDRGTDPSQYQEYLSSINPAEASYTWGQYEGEGDARRQIVKNWKGEIVRVGDPYEDSADSSNFFAKMNKETLRSTPDILKAGKTVIGVAVPAFAVADGLAQMGMGAGTNNTGMMVGGALQAVGGGYGMSAPVPTGAASMADIGIGAAKGAASGAVGSYATTGKVDPLATIMGGVTGGVGTYTAGAPNSNPYGSAANEKVYTDPGYVNGGQPYFNVNPNLDITGATQGYNPTFNASDFSGSLANAGAYNKLTSGGMFSEGSPQNSLDSNYGTLANKDVYTDPTYVNNFKPYFTTDPKLDPDYREPEKKTDYSGAIKTAIKLGTGLLENSGYAPTAGGTGAASAQVDNMTTSPQMISYIKKQQKLLDKEEDPWTKKWLHNYYA